MDMMQAQSLMGIKVAKYSSGLEFKIVDVFNVGDGAIYFVLEYRDGARVTVSKNSLLEEFCASQSFASLLHGATTKKADEDDDEEEDMDMIAIKPKSTDDGADKKDVFRVEETDLQEFFLESDYWVQDCDGNWDCKTLKNYEELPDGSGYAFSMEDWSIYFHIYADYEYRAYGDRDREEIIDRLGGSMIHKYDEPTRRGAVIGVTRKKGEGWLATVEFPMADIGTTVVVEMTMQELYDLYVYADETPVGKRGNRVERA